MSKKGNTANDLIIQKEESNDSQVNTMQDTIKEMGRLLFEDYKDKTSNLTIENIEGITMARVLNDYMGKNWDYRLVALDGLIENKLILTVSKEGYGIKSIIEFLKSIQASFEQHQLPDRIGSLLKR